LIVPLFGSAAHEPAHYDDPSIEQSSNVGNVIVDEVKQLHKELKRIVWVSVVEKGIFLSITRLNLRRVKGPSEFPMALTRPWSTQASDSSDVWDGLRKPVCLWM
jgi:hypothetical protein